MDPPSVVGARAGLSAYESALRLMFMQAAARPDSSGSGAVSSSVQAATPADAEGGLTADLSRGIETAGIVLPPGSDVVAAADESRDERAKTGPARQSSGLEGRQGFPPKSGRKLTDSMRPQGSPLRARSGFNSWGRALFFLAKSST